MEEKQKYLKKNRENLSLEGWPESKELWLSKVLVALQQSWPLLWEVRARKKRGRRKEGRKQGKKRKKVRYIRTLKK